MLDAHVYKWNLYPGQHCMRSFNVDGYPRMLYSSGISGMTNLKADDKVGIIFCVVIAFLQLEMKEMLSKIVKMSNLQYKIIVYVFQKMLCYCAWLKLDKYWQRGDEVALLSAEEAIEKLLNNIIKKMPRTSRNK